MSAKYKSPSFLLPNEINTNTNPLNTDGNPATGTGINSLYSMDFNAPSSAYVDLGIITEINGLSNFTFSVWIKPVSPLGGSQGIVFGNRDSNNSHKGIALALHGQYLTGTSYVYFEGNILSIPTGTFTFDQWSHVVITYDNATLAVYVDNSLIDSASLANISLTSTAAFNLGRDVGAPVGKYFNGQIDEFAIFNKALNATERAALYDGTGSNIRPSNLMAANLNPIAYYPLGEQAQNTGKLPEATANVWQFPNGVLQDYVMDFDGNEKINCGPAKAYDIVTLSAWVKPDSPSTYAGIFGTRNGSNVDFPYQLTNLGGKFRFIADGTTAILSDNGFNSGVWYHVMGIADGTNLKMYVNGQLQNATASYSTPLPTPNNDLMIGAQWDTDVQYEWSGEISNAAIWNTDQTANKDNIYNNGSPQTTYTVTPQNWWKLNATSVYTPSAPSYTTALDFDAGSSQYISTTASISGFTSFTISAWANAETLTTADTLVGQWRNGNTSNSAFLMYLVSNTMHFYIGSGSSAILAGGDTTLSTGQWYHFCATWDGTTTKLYINGVQESTTGSASSMNTTTVDLLIGAYNNSAGTGVETAKTWNGSISNVAVYNSALSASQISTLFNFGTPETTPSFSLVAWWKLDNTTTGIQDSSGNGNNGTNNGATNSPGGVAYVPSWKIPSALPIATPNYTTALDFDGSNDNIDISGYTGLKNASAFTISVWFKGRSFTTDYIFSTSTATGTWYHNVIGLYLKDNQLKTNVWFGNVNSGISNVSIDLNKWYHAAITFDGSTGTATTYVNATAYVGSGNLGTTSPNFDTNLMISGLEYAAGSTSYYFDGEISNFQVFNTALSATGSNSVETLYNNGSPLTSMSGFTSLQGWWKLDTGGSTITDSAGSNNGTNSSPGAAQVTSDVLTPQPVNGVSTTLPSTALQQSDLQFDSPYSNYSLYFDGNSYIDTNFTLPASYTSFSYSFWFKRTTSANPGTEYIISNLVAPGNNTQARGLIRFGVTNLRIQGGDGTSPDYDTGNISATAILDQNWHHISVTFVSGEIKTYFDGSLVNTYTNSLVVTGYAADRTYVIGQNGIGTGYLVNSRLDEFAIFDKKLTEAEILSIYNSGRPGDISPIAPTNWWRLGENAYFVNNDITLPNSVSGAPNGVSSGTATSMLTADAPGTYANGIGTNLDIVDRVGDAALSTANSQSYNMIPDDKVPYVPGYVGDQISNTYSMAFDDSSSDYMVASNLTSIVVPRANANKGLSVSVWVNISNVVGSNWHLLGSGASTRRGPFTAEGSGPKVRFWLRDPSSVDHYLDTTDNPLTGRANEWIHLAYVWDGTAAAGDRMKIYIDGVQNTSATINGPTSLMASGSHFNNDALIGAYRLSSASPGVDLMMDEMAIFDKTLTADQIKFDLYNATTTGKTADIANNPNLPTPVAWYRMGD